MGASKSFTSVVAVAIGLAPVQHSLRKKSRSPMHRVRKKAGLQIRSPEPELKLKSDVIGAGAQFKIDWSWSYNHLRSSYELRHQIATMDLQTLMLPWFNDH